MKILFLHGLNSQPYQDRIDLLSKYGTVDMPLINYQEDNNIYLTYLQQAIDQKYDIIMGHSLGATLAFYICNILQIKCLMFMPSFNPDNKKLLSLSDTITNNIKNQDILTIISVSDKIVNNQLTQDIIPTDNIIEVGDIQGDNGHSLSSKLLEKWFKFFTGLNEGLITSFRNFTMYYHLNESRNNKFDHIINAKLGTIISESEIYQYVEYLHYKDDPYSSMEDGNLDQRIECYTHFKFENVDINEINYNQFEIDEDKVDEYVALFKKTNTYPPIVLGHQFFINDDAKIEKDENDQPIVIGDDYEIIDGTHRIKTLIECGYTSIKAWIGILK